MEPPIVPTGFHFFQFREHTRLWKGAGKLTLLSFSPEKEDV